MQWRRAVVWVLFIEVVCGVLGQSVSAEEVLKLSGLRFVESDVLEMGMVSGDRRGFTGLYNTSDGTSTPLWLSERYDPLSPREPKVLSVCPEVPYNRPSALWQVGKVLFIVALDGTAKQKERYEYSVRGRHRVLMAFPDKDLFLQLEEEKGVFDTKCFLRHKLTEDIVEQCSVDKVIMNISVSPAFGEGRNFFLMDASEALANLQERREAVLYSVRPLRRVSWGLLPSFNALRYVYDEKSSDLVVVLQDIPGAYHFLRVRPNPDNTEQAFEIKEFDALEGATEATWRNGLIWWSNSEGVTIEKREPGTETQRVVVPYRRNADGVPEDGEFVVNGDGTLLCVARPAFFNGGCAFRVYKVNFPTVTCVGEYIAQWDKDAKVPKITKREKSETVATVAGQATPAAEKAEPKPGETRTMAGIDFVWIPPGSFERGENAEIRHRVTLAKGFWLGKYEITQAQWRGVTGNDPSDSKGDNRPVESVSWNDCQDFINKLNAKGEGTFRLPSEAEWEYACRAGSTTEYCFGDDASQLGDYAWFEGNSDSKTHPVGEKKPNAWGLYDMLGNVSEWCQDLWLARYYGDGDYTGGPRDGSAWEMPADRNRVHRGGSWDHPPRFFKSAFRAGSQSPCTRYDLYGFRLASPAVR